MATIKCPEKQWIRSFIFREIAKSLLLLDNLISDASCAPPPTEGLKSRLPVDRVQRGIRVYFYHQLSLSSIILLLVIQVC